MTRSIDNVHFKVIGRQTGNHVSTLGKKYSFKDANPSAINYYRLKQVDYNGNYVYSDILYSKPVYIEPLNVVENGNGLLSIQTNITNTTKNNLRLFDISGKFVKSFYIQNNRTAIDISTVAKGYYILQLVINNGSVYTKKLYKR